jgi:hypothetical protein
VTKLTQSLSQLTFLRNELLFTPYQAVFGFHAYSFKQSVIDNIDWIYDQNSGILSSFCPMAMTFTQPYQSDILYLLSYCDTDFAPKLVKVQYNTLLYKVLRVWSLNIPAGQLNWGRPSDICNLNWGFSSSPDSKSKNGVVSSLLFRHGDVIYEINPNNGYDISILDLSLLNGEKKTTDRLFSSKDNATPSINKF